MLPSPLGPLELQEGKQRSLTAEISQVPRQGRLSGLGCVQDLTLRTPPHPRTKPLPKVLSASHF